MDELSILEVIQKYDHISQREISSETGLSLGMVNMLIKKFLKVGLLKSEKLSGNKVKYLLTPKGSQVILEKTVNYVKRSYMAVLKISNHVESVLLSEFYNVDEVPINGVSPEVEAIVVDVARRLGKSIVRVDSVSSGSKVLYLDSPSDACGVGVFDGVEFDLKNGSKS